MDQFNRDTFLDDKVRNYLVEKRGLRILSTIPLHTRRCRDGNGREYLYKEGGNHWHFRENVKNHSEVVTSWNPTEEWGVIFHDGKWWFEAIYLCHRTKTGFTLVEIGDRVEDYVRAYLRRRHTAVYDKAHREDGRDPFVTAFKITVRPPYLTLDISAGIPKIESALDLDAQLFLRIQPHQGSFIVVPTELRPITR